nr:hypothetical protein [Saprospiraceae bacterium]
INDNDFYLQGTLSDFPALLHKYDRLINVSLEGKSKKIDIREIMSFVDPINSAPDEFIEDLSFKLAFESKPNDLLNFKYLPKGEFFVDDFHAKFKNYPHTFHDFHVDIVIDDSALKVKDFTGMIDNTDFHFTGKIDNYPKWFQATPKGDSNIEFILDSKHFELIETKYYKIPRSMGK